MNRLTFSDFTVRLRRFIGGRGASAAVEDAFNELALGLFQLQFTSNLPYRRFCEAQRISQAEVTNWTEIPAIPTSAFKELELTSLAPAQRSTVFESSGTAGQHPSLHFHCAESLAIYEASILPWFQAHLLGNFSNNGKARMLFLTPPSVATPRSSLVHMFELVRRQYGADSSVFLGSEESNRTWTIDKHRTRLELARAVEEERPVIVLGTAFSFVHLLDFLAERNERFQLPAGSRVLETGGYKGRSRVLPKSELHAMINEILSVPPEDIICEYGMSELSSQAYDRPGSNGSSRVFHFPPWARVQVVSPETGREVAENETGLIRVFDLANVWSVMAVQTEDLATRHNIGFELLGRTMLAEPRGCSLMAG